MIRHIIDDIKRFLMILMKNRCFLVNNYVDCFMLEYKHTHEHMSMLIKYRLLKACVA